MLSNNKTKNKILTASLKMLNEGGYGSLNISELARQAKLSKQNLFYHYPNMDDIFFELVMLWSQSGQTCAMEALANCHASGARRIEGIIKGMFLWIKCYPELSKLGLTMFQSGTQVKKIKDFMDSSRDIGRQRILDILQSDIAFNRINSKKMNELITGVHTIMYGSFLYIAAMNDFKNLESHEESCLNNINRLLEPFLKPR